MLDKKLPFPASASLVALKTAIMVEQQVLQLDPHIARTRTEALLNEPLCETLFATTPIVVLSREKVLL